MLEFLVGYFGSPWWLVVAALVWVVAFAVYHDVHHAGPANARWVSYLREDSWLAWYRRTIGATLDWLDRRLTPDIPRKRFPPESVQVAWSGGLAGFALALAVAYPVLAVIGQWVFLNSDGRLGPLLLLEGGKPGWLRYGTMSLLVGAVAGWYAAYRAQGLSRLVLALVATGLAVAGAGAFAGAVAVAVAVAGAFAVAGAVAVAVAFAVAGAGAGAGAVAVAGAVVVVWVGDRLGRPATGLAVWTIGLLAVLAAVTATVAEPSARPVGEVAALLLFLGTLPILNGLADFLSLGLTRWTMRQGLREGERIWAWMLADLAAGLALLLLLGFAIIAYVHAVRFPDGTPLADLPAVFAEIRTAPAAYWWVYVMLFTTLLPTLLHLLVASFGGVLQLSPWLRSHIADGLERGAQGDAVLGRWAVQWLCLAMTVSVMAPVMAAGLLWVNAEAIGLAFLDVFEGFAWLIGVL